MDMASCKMCPFGSLARVVWSRATYGEVCFVTTESLKRYLSISIILCAYLVSWRVCNCVANSKSGLGERMLDTLTVKSTERYVNCYT